MAVIPDVVVVDAREPILGHAPVAGTLVVLGLKRLERGAVLNSEAAEIAEPDRLAGALEAAAGFGHDLRRRIGDLVLDIALVALVGLEGLHPVARLLDLGRERHDRQELRLRLGQGLAGPDLGQVVPAQVGVRCVGRTTALGHGLDHGRGADPDIPGGEDAAPRRLEGDGVRLEPLVAGCRGAR